MLGTLGGRGGAGRAEARLSAPTEPVVLEACNLTFAVFDKGQVAAQVVAEAGHTEQGIGKAREVAVAILSPALYQALRVGAFDLSAEFVVVDPGVAAQGIFKADGAPDGIRVEFADPPQRVGDCA